MPVIPTRNYYAAAHYLTDATVILANFVTTLFIWGGEDAFVYVAELGLGLQSVMFNFGINIYL
jgi:hypothetical protein